MFCFGRNFRVQPNTIELTTHWKVFKVKTGNIWQIFKICEFVSILKKINVFENWVNDFCFVYEFLRLFLLKRRSCFFVILFPKKQRHQINFCQKVWQNMRLNRISDRSFWLEIQIIENWTKKIACSIYGLFFVQLHLLHCGQMKLWIWWKMSTYAPV